MFTLRFEGGTELARELDKMSLRVGKTLLREALHEGAEPIRRHAASAAPYAPGAPDLRDNIVIGNARSADMAAVAIGPRKGFAPRSDVYPRAQEYGTAHHGAQPFMRPAFDTQSQAAIRIITQALWRMLAARGVTRSATVETPVQSPGALL